MQDVPIVNLAFHTTLLILLEAHTLSLSRSLSRGSSLSLPRLPSRERPTAVVWRTIERWCYVKVNFLSSVQCKSMGQTRCKAKTLLIYPAQSVIYFKLHIRKIVTGVVGANSREWVLELYHLYFGPRWYIKSRLRTQIHIYMFINLDDTRSGLRTSRVFYSYWI